MAPKEHEGLEIIGNSTLPARPPAPEHPPVKLAVFHVFNSFDDLYKLNKLLFMAHEIKRIRRQVKEASQPKKNKDAIERQKRVLRKYGEVYKKILEHESAIRLGVIIAEREFLVSINKLQDAKKLSDEMREILSELYNKLQDAKKPSNEMREALVAVLNDAIHELSGILSISEALPGGCNDSYKVTQSGL